MNTHLIGTDIWTARPHFYGSDITLFPGSSPTVWDSNCHLDTVSGQSSGYRYGINLSVTHGDHGRGKQHADARIPHTLATVNIDITPVINASKPATTGAPVATETNQSSETCHVIEVLNRPDAKERKTILVTGASGGMGTGICELLAQQGLNLILAARNLEKLSSQARELKNKFGGHYVPARVDFNDTKSIQELCEKLSIELDGLVLMPPRIPPATDVLPENNVWMSVFEQTFVNPLALVKGLLPRMKSQSRSKVVIISGISSVQVVSHYALNNAIRAAWAAQAKTLAFAYGEQGIHFNTLSIGGAMTPKYVERMQAKAQANGVSFDEQMAEEVANVPLRKYATLEDIANAVFGLLSPFSDHITGANILLDGGFTKSY